MELALLAGCRTRIAVGSDGRCGSRGPRLVTAAACLPACYTHPLVLAAILCATEPDTHRNRGCQHSWHLNTRNHTHSSHGVVFLPLCTRVRVCATRTAERWCAVGTVVVFPPQRDSKLSLDDVCPAG